MSEPICYLYADACDHLADYLGGAAQDVEQRIVRRSIVRAYEHLANERSWQYLYSNGQVLLQPSYNTGTVVFDLTGGTYERMLTLTGGTWPSYAKFCRIRIDNVVYEVDDRKSNSVITLTAGKCPGADVSSIAFTLYQNIYQLPSDFRRICEPQTYQAWWSYYIRPQDWQWLEWHGNSTGVPVRWTIGQDLNRTAGYAIYVDPYPATAMNFDFMYQRWPRALVLTGAEANSRVGTVAITGTAVTGTATAFSANMVGSYLRLSSSATIPDGLGGLNPYAEQRKIRSWTSATAIALDTAPDGTYSGAGYTVSDPVDMPQGFVGAFMRCCEWQYAMLGRTKDVGAALGFYAQALGKAAESDSVAEIDRNLGPQDRSYDRGWFQGAGTPIN